MVMRIAFRAYRADIAYQAMARANCSGLRENGFPCAEPMTSGWAVVLAVPAGACRLSSSGVAGGRAVGRLRRELAA
jgi:hypothetical protein